MVQIKCKCEQKLNDDLIRISLIPFDDKYVVYYCKSCKSFFLKSGIELSWDDIKQKIPENAVIDDLIAKFERRKPFESLLDQAINEYNNERYDEALTIFQNLNISDYPEIISLIRKCQIEIRRLERENRLLKEKEEMERRENEALQRFKEEDRLIEERETQRLRIENHQRILNTVFFDFKLIKRTDMPHIEIFYLFDYHRKWLDESKTVLNPKHDTLSKSILGLKSNLPSYIEMWTNKFKEYIRNDNTFAICVIPSSKKGLNESGIRAVASNLCQNKIINATSCLIRAYDVNPNHSGPRRTYTDEYKSLNIMDAEKIKGQIILLLDDVTTRGTTFKAAKNLLMNTGARYVISLAIGKTVFEGH